MRNFGLNRRRHANPDAGKGTPDNRAILSHTGVSVAICCLVAAMMPKVLAAVALKTMLLWAAIAIGAVAALRREPLNPLRLTRWDEALTLILLALLAGLLIDPEIARDIAAAA